MAILYVRSTDGDDADNGSTWALAKATLAGAAAAAAAGDTIYVSQAHAESQASAMTITFPGTAGSPNIVLCGNDAAEPPTALATTAVVKTTGSNALTMTGAAYIYGITFRAAEGGASTNMNLGVSGNSGQFIFDTCRLEMMATTYSHLMVSSSYSNSSYLLLNTVVKFGSTGGHIYTLSASFRWVGGSLDVTTAIPAYLFYAGRGSCVRLDGVDLSGLNTRLYGSISAGSCIVLDCINCKTHANLVLLENIIPAHDGEVRSDYSDSGDTNYKMDHRKYQGSIVTETTIKRAGGASDGTTELSWKMVTLASGAQFYLPLASPPIAVWNETTGSSKTLTVEIVHDSLTNLQDDEVWVEVDYMGTSGFPTTTRISDRMTNILSTAADQATSTETWTTTGLTNPNKQKLAVAFTPQHKGPVVARVMLAKANYTVYVCPKVTIS